jgi:hypothetical protein
MKLAIFDLDGCLSDDRRRRPLLPTHGVSDPDYEAYHADCGGDPVINADVVRQHQKAGDHILFITARPEKFRPQTLEWLTTWFSLDRFTLLMRPDGDSAPSPQLKVRLFEEEPAFKWTAVAAAYDDRPDILNAYAAKGVGNCQVLTFGPPTVPEIMRDMASTFEERNRVYGSNYKMVGPIMKIFFPDGAPPEVLHSDQFHLFELKIVKLSRFAISGLTHLDSIHDDAVYSAMIESILLEDGE